MIPKNQGSLLQRGAIWRFVSNSTRRTVATIMGRPTTFEAWKTLLRNDCIALNKLRAFEGLGDSVLKILYENGLDPTVQCIVTNGLSGRKSTQITPKISD